MGQTFISPVLVAIGLGWRTHKVTVQAAGGLSFQDQPCSHRRQRTNISRQSSIMVEPCYRNWSKLVQCRFRIMIEIAVSGAPSLHTRRNRCDKPGLSTCCDSASLQVNAHSKLLLRRVSFTQIESLMPAMAVLTYSGLASSRSMSPTLVIPRWSFPRTFPSPT